MVPRSFETVYQYTLNVFNGFLNKVVHLVILPVILHQQKHLRTIQQNDLQTIAPGKRVLGCYTGPLLKKLVRLPKQVKWVFLGTNGTVKSGSYPIEIEKFFPDVEGLPGSLPMWVPLIENNEYE